MPFTESDHEFLPSLISAATAVDGQSPFSDQSLVDLGSGTRSLLTAEWNGHPAAAALVTRNSALTEAELVVHPNARHHGLGDQLLRQVIERSSGQLLVWAHGDHADARALAMKHNLEPVRELLQMRAEVTSAEVLASGKVSAFREGIDDGDWLALNARAFAAHPEQGKFTAADLDARKAEKWFNAEDFLLLRDTVVGEGDSVLTGFCWLKVDDGVGEFYAVGVDPERQGEGLGRVLVAAGLKRLAAAGIRQASLYVEADNTAAVRLYRSFGFSEYSIDIQYRLAR